jgi:hypothetical protein
MLRQVQKHRQHQQRHDAAVHIKVHDVRDDVARQHISLRDRVAVVINPLQEDHHGEQQKAVPFRNPGVDLRMRLSEEAQAEENHQDNRKNGEIEEVGPADSRQGSPPN